MRVPVRFLSAALLTAGAPLAGAAETAGGGPELAVALTPEHLTVGDRVTAVLTVTVPAAPGAGEPRFPVWPSRWGAAEILTAGEPESLGGGEGTATFRQRLVLAAFRPGEVALPPVAVEVPLARGTVVLSTPRGLAFTVRSVLPPPAGDAGGEPERLERRPEAPPRELPLGRRFWWTAGILGTACLALALLDRRRRWTAVVLEERQAPPLPPLAELEAELARLATAAGPEGWVILSRALRRYLGRRLGFPAAESTTSEIRRRLECRDLPVGLAERGGAVLHHCDLVKFACQEPDRTALRRCGETARGIGRELEQHLTPPEPAAPAGGGSEP